MQSPYTQKVYPVDKTIADIDVDYEAEEVLLNGVSYYCGQLDPDYNVQWLYSEEGTRVGCLEKENVLWYYDNPWGTFLQEDGWSVHDQSIWSRMTPAAYEECFRRGWSTIDTLQKQTSMMLLRLEDVMQEEYPDTYVHCKCGKTHRNQKRVLTPFNVICVDDDGVIYIPPTSTSLFKRPCDDVPLQQSPPQAQPELPGSLPESPE